MVNRIISVGDDFTLPSAVNVADANLPAASKAAAVAAALAAKLDTTTAASTYATTAAVASATSPKLDKTEAATTYVRFVDLAGNPITARRVTIKVDTSTWDIADIIAEA